tara:strand:+ start:764 stop:1405 length:642 start_codon:yes stop_codon:yes gene_type:complete
MKDIITPGYIANFVVNLFIFILLASAYTYIQKLENEGIEKCGCAFEYPHVGFIKSFSIFALVFILFVMFIPPGTVLANLFGKELSGLYTFVIFVFYIVFAVYIFMTMTYTRQLVSTGCSCSSDIRRELLLVGSTIELILLVLLLLTSVVFPIVLSGLTIFFDNAKNISKKIESNLKNPVKGFKEVPGQLNKLSNQVGKVVSTTTKGVKSLTKK